MNAIKNATTTPKQLQTFTLPDGRTFKVTTCKSTSGSKAARIQKIGGRACLVPAELCAIGAGKDAWMRNIIFKCNDCGTPHTADELYNGELPGSCASCAEKYFHCDICGGTHHPDDACPTK